MKLSLLVTALIVAGFGWFGWQGQTRLAAAQQGHDRLIAEAQELGIGTDDLSGKEKLPRSAKSQRGDQGDREIKTRAFASKLIALAAEMKRMQTAREEPDEAMQKRIFEIMGEMMELDPSQLKTLVGELRATHDLDDEMRGNIVGFAIMMMANDHPAAALALFTESGDLSKNDRNSSRILASALTKLAEQDPMGAMEWIRKNSKDHADLIDNNTRSAVLTGAARQDPKLAFSLIAELGLTQSNTAAFSIVMGAKTPVEQTAVLLAMRDYLATATDEATRQSALQGTLSGLAQKSMEGGYDSAAKWLESANLSPEETKAFVTNLQSWPMKEDSGKWMDWMSAKLPAQDSAGKITEVMDRWTQQDYKAAGTWLNDVKEGPAKSAAVLSYATNVAPYEPATAAQWALTLPAGERRTELLNKVYEEWQKKDGTAAAAFAKQNGIAAGPPK